MKQLWKCEFCNVKEMQRGTLVKHERQCRSNPMTKLCFTCSNFRPGSKTCDEGIKVFNVHTSGIPCSKWFQKN